MVMQNPKIIKITPYRGIDNEIIEGRKTKIHLYDDRMEYSIKYTQKIKIQLGDDEAIIRETISFNEEDGFMMKNDISGIVKYIKTEYKDDLEPYNINFVDICSNGNSITFSVESEEEKNNLYDELHEWKTNK